MSEPATDAPTPQQVLALPMQQPNDANAATIRDYLIKLLARLWEEGECFSGKRPLGNSSWEWDLFIPLVRAGFIAGKFETYDGKETGGLDECDDATGTALIDAAIKALGQPAEQPQNDGDVRAVARTVWMYGTDEHSSEHAYATIEQAQTEAIWEYDASMAEYPEYWSWESCPPQTGRLAMLCGDDRTGYTVYPVTVVEQPDAALDARDARTGEQR